MRLVRPLLAAVAVAALAAGTTAATAAPPAPEGKRCGVSTVADPTTPGGGNALLSGGPVSVPAFPNATIVLVCGMQSTPYYPDEDIVRRTASGAGSATLDPTLVTYRTRGGPAYVCTDVTFLDRETGLTGTFYWDARTRTWLTQPYEALCDKAPEIYGAVVGGVSIDHTLATGPAPVVTLSGYLADPTLFACTSTVYSPLAPFTVTCTPLPSASFTWYCAVLHVNALAATPGAVAHGTMDCDGDNVPEAQTATVTGPGGADGQWSQSNTPVSVFTCTAGNGTGGALVPDSHVFCGDPGAAEVR